MGLRFFRNIALRPGFRFGGGFLCFGRILDRGVPGFGRILGRGVPGFGRILGGDILLCFGRILARGFLGFGHFFFGGILGLAVRPADLDSFLRGCRRFDRLFIGRTFACFHGGLGLRFNFLCLPGIFQTPGDLLPDLSLHSPGRLLPGPVLGGGGHFLAHRLFIFHRHRLANGVFRLGGDHLLDFVGLQLSLNLGVDLGLHGVAGQLLFDLGLNGRGIGMAHGVFHLCPGRSGHCSDDLFAHGGLNLLSHLGLCTLAHLLHHGFADSGLDLLLYLRAHGSFDLFLHLGLGALLYLLGHDLANAGLHLGLHLFENRVVDAVHHQLVGGFLHLAHNLFLHRCANLGGQLPVGLGVYVVHYLVQQLPLQPGYLLGVVVQGERLQFNVQLVEVGLLALQLVVGGINEGLKHLLCGVHQSIAVSVDLVQALGQGGGAVRKLPNAVQQVVGAVVQRVDALLKLIRAVIQRLCAIAQVAGALAQLPRAVLQVISAVVELLRAVQQVNSAVGQPVRAFRQGFGAVPQRAGAIRQRCRAVLQLVHGVPQVRAQGVGVQVDLVLFIHDVRHIAGGEGIGAVGGVVHHVRFDGTVRGHVDIHLVVVRQVQRLGDSRQAIAHRATQVARGDILAVGDGNIGELLLVHLDNADHQEGHGHLLPPAVDDHLVLQQRLVADVDPQMAALAGQVFGFDRLTVQLVFEMYRHRQGRVGGAFIGDLVAAGFPGDHAVGDGGIRLVAADVFDVFKAGDVHDLILAFVVIQPLADRDVVHIALGVREDIDGLLLVLRQGDRGCAPAEHGQDDHRRDATQAIAFHIYKPPFLRHV